MTRLVLIRHAMPKIDEAVPAPDWHLSDEGREAATALAAHLKGYTFPRIVSSAEPKAIGTAQAIAAVLRVPTAVDDGFAEHKRRNIGFAPRAEIDAGVARLFAQPHDLVFGDETAAAAITRFGAALARQGGPVDSMAWGRIEPENSGVPPPPGGEDIAVVTHGTILTLYLSRVYPRLGDAFAFWKSLKLPEALVLSATGLERIA